MIEVFFLGFWTACALIVAAVMILEYRRKNREPKGLGEIKRRQR